MSEWISIKDAMPPLLTLVACKYLIRPSGFDMYDIIFGWANSEAPEFGEESPTHWMLLPEPPEDK